MTSTLALVAGLAGGAAIAAGAALGRRGWRRGHPARSRLVMAASALLWGVGHLLAVSQEPSTIRAGPWWLLAASLLALAGAALMPRRSRESLDGLRLAAEAGMLASAISILLFVLLDVTTGLGATDARQIVVLITLDSALFAVLFVSAARDPDRGIALAALGAALYLAGGVCAGVVALAGDGAVAVEALLGGAGLLLIGAGLLVADPEPHEPSEPHPRDAVARPTVSASAALLVVTVAVVLIGLSRTAVGPVHGALAVMFLSAFWLRELVRDVQQGRLMRRLAEQAATDPLTGLGNRRALAVAMADLYTPPHRSVCVLTLDLDNFKTINTLLGHHIGDSLLGAVARDLEEQCGGHRARAFRLGGDEFAILMEGTPAEAAKLAEGLVARVPAVAATVPGAGRVAISASIGIAHHPADAGGADSPDAAGEGLADLNRSGDAMRAAKAAGRSRVMTYGTPLARQQSRRDALERRLRRAIACDGLDLHLQPIISLPEMRMTGMESLARWEDEELGHVSPVKFIPVAEDCGLIGELGLQLLRRSMEMTMSTGAHARGLVIGVNVSPIQLRSPGFATQAAALIEEIGVNPQQVAIEITESVRIEDDDPAVTAICQLADLGLSIAIDDFGTGYSSLSLISRLPARILKLDRSITQQLDDPRGLAIARCVSDMARAIGVDVVAEGIETVEHLTAVRRLDVGFGQGWLFSKAVTAERFAEFVHDPGLVLRDCPAEMLVVPRRR